MDKKQVIQTVKDVLESPFNKDKFVYFIKNLLNEIDESKALQMHGVYVPESFRDYVNNYERIGTYTDPDDKKIDILVVNLQKESTIERARTAQRNFIARYLKQRGEKEAGLVAFVSPNPEDWRFSFVKMDYKLVETKKGNIKAEEEFTPAKRYSFLVGENESSHTAQSCLVQLLQNDDVNPSLEEVEKSFSIEKVTKEFFENYRGLFIKVKEALDNIVKKDPDIKEDFDQKGVNTADFAKKMLGQIVFLYFLQKKGWFGVEKGKDWGTGSKDFLRRLFDKKIVNYKNFFNDILEPLFYEALATDRGELAYWDTLKCRIPFLNGGLFEPINNYSWETTDIYLPDELFSNSEKTKQGDIGTGIFDVFDRYNFTVKEDEPLEKEVAIDPEMLGKVFENLLEVKDRKSKGTYYTPREIVHYMCQESLINYLATELESKVSKDDIDFLIHHGEKLLEYEYVAQDKQKDIKNGKLKGSTYASRMPQSIKVNSDKIDQHLVDIKVCDPAIGSGAFPVGMMSEIVRARNVLTRYLATKENRTVYDFKNHAIHNSLYGVDIDPGAVEIAKLRLWLSLVVEEEDIKHIRPLPNLAYKIIQGNSLLEEYEGIKLFDEKFIAPLIDNSKEIQRLKDERSKFQREYFLLHKEDKLTDTRKQILELEVKKVTKRLKQLEKMQKQKSENLDLLDMISEANKKMNKLNKLHEEFIDASQKSKKNRLRKEIEELEWDLIETTLKEQGKEESLKNLEQFKRTNVKPFFLWKLHFADVFQEKGGFDVVIGNPPYQGFRDMNKKLKEILQRNFKSAIGKFDLYIPFIEKGFYCLKDNGFFVFICPTAFMKRKHGKNIRNFLVNYTSIYELIDFEHTQIFDRATNYTGIFSFFKSIPVRNKYKYRAGFVGNFIQDEQTKLFDSPWVFTDAHSKLITSKIQDNMKLVEIVNITEGVVTGLNKLYLKTKKEIEGGKFESEFFVPSYRGKEIERYCLSPCSQLLFYPYMLDNNKTVPFDESVLEQKCPVYLKHLKKNLKLIKGREYFINSNKKWYELWNQRDIRIFKSQKIITPELSDVNKFMIAEPNVFFGDTVCGIVLKDALKDEFELKYLLSILNSSLIEWFYKKTTVPKAGGYFIYKVMYLNNIPIKRISVPEQQAFVRCVNTILTITKSSNYPDNPAKQAKVKEYERQIDKMVYKIYGLTEEEIETVDNFKKM